MKQYQKSVVSFLKQTGLPVYMTGQVPGGAKFPYITLTCAYAPFAQTAALTATAWFCEEHAHARCLDLMDALCSAVPESGALLHYRGGMAVMHRASGDFITLVGDEQDRRIIGGRMRLTVNLYDS